MQAAGRVGALLLVLASLGCISVGRHFPEQAVSQLQVGQTTQQQVLETFGPPWRTGVDSGQRTWTYGYYHYSLFGAPQARDLVIKFDSRGIVSSYNYNATTRDP
jgi:outer membrane protein assembly factor BamE (lipoprotein component of BamABCDE complex)